MPFIIYNDGRLMGYTLDKKTAKQFRNERSGDTEIIEVDSMTNLISAFGKSDAKKNLIMYSDVYKRVLVNKELYAARRVAMARVLELHTVYIDLVRASRFLKFTDRENVPISSLCNYIERLVDDLSFDESCVTYDEYFDIGEILDNVIKLKQ